MLDKSCVEESAQDGDRLPSGGHLAFCLRVVYALCVSIVYRICTGGGQASVLVDNMPVTILHRFNPQLLARRSHTLQKQNAHRKTNILQGLTPQKPIDTQKNPHVGRSHPEKINENT